MLWYFEKVASTGTMSYVGISRTEDNSNYLVIIRALTELNAIWCTFLIFPLQTPLFAAPLTYHMSPTHVITGKTKTELTCILTRHIKIAFLPLHG